MAADVNKASEAYNTGYEAASRGEPVDSCEYADDTWERDQWMSGYWDSRGDDAVRADVITKVHVYSAGGKWYYSAWCGNEHDHNGDIPDASDESEAREFVRREFPNATVKNVT